MVTTAVGNLTDDPELRFTSSGRAVVGFTVAVNAQRFDREAGKYVDAGTSFLRCNAWGQLAENVAESLGKGARVIVTGRLAEDHWENDKGEKRSAFKLTADAVGPDLAWATAKVSKASRRDDVAPDDPWASASRTRPEPMAAGGEPPF